jgi:hypothetical protein
VSRARNFPLSIRQLLAWWLALLASLVLAGAAQALTVQPPPTEERFGDDKIAVDLYAARANGMAIGQIPAMQGRG